MIVFTISYQYITKYTKYFIKLILPLSSMYLHTDFFISKISEKKNHSLSRVFKFIKFQIRSWGAILSPSSLNEAAIRLSLSLE